LFEDQLSCADLIVLNKADLIDRDALEQVHRFVEHKKRAPTKIVSAVQGNLPVDLIIGQNVSTQWQQASDLHHHTDREHEHHDHDDFESFIVNVPPARHVAEVEHMVADVMKRYGILRAKGFIAIQHKPMRLVVQAVGPRVQSYFDRHWREDERQYGRLVIIGLNGLDRKAIEEELCGVPA